MYLCVGVVHERGRVGKRNDLRELKGERDGSGEGRKHMKRKPCLSLSLVSLAYNSVLE